MAVPFLTTQSRSQHLEAGAVDEQLGGVKIWVEGVYEAGLVDVTVVAK